MAQMVESRKRQKLERDCCCGSRKDVGEKTVERAGGRTRYVSSLRLTLCPYTRRAFRTVNFFGELLASRKFLGLQPLHAVRIPSSRYRANDTTDDVCHIVYIFLLHERRCKYQSEQ